MTFPLAKLKFPQVGGVLYATVQLDGPTCEPVVFLLATVETPKDSAILRRFSTVNGVVVRYSQGGMIEGMTDKPASIVGVKQFALRSPANCEPVRLVIRSKDREAEPWVAQLLY